MFIRDFTSTMVGREGGTQVCLSQKKHQETSILLTSIYNKTYIKIIFSAKKQLAITSTSKMKKTKSLTFRIALAGIHFFFIIIIYTQ